MARISVPKQARSQRTLERLVAAGLALLDEGRPDAVTVQAVVAKARSSVGSFYARFRGKDDLLEHLREHVRRSTEAEWSQSLEAESWEASLEGMASRAVDLLLDLRPDHDARIRTADRLVADAEDDEPTRKALDELAARLLERRDEITHPDPETAVRIGLAAILGVSTHARVAASDARGEGTDTLRAECTQLLLGYLAGRPRDESGPVDFFDVWG
ncbi:MAG: TetR/AcrR family transcriptional regulator [Gemmatimonadales bacterium]